MAMIKRLHDDGHEVEYYIHDSIVDKNLKKARDIVWNKNNSFVSVIDGKSGVGKSTFGIQICKYLDPNFTINNIAWTPQRFLDLIQNAKKGSAIMFDEGMIINSRSATSQVNKAIMIALSQIRSRNIFIIININSIFDLDRNIALHRADLLYHVYTKDDLVDGEKRIKVYGRQKLKYLYITGKKFYSYRAPPNFFARPPRKYVFLVNEGEYERRKRKETIDNTDISQTGSKTERKFKLLAAKVIMAAKKLGVSQKALADEMDERVGNLSYVVVWAKDNNLV